MAETFGEKNILNIVDGKAEDMMGEVKVLDIGALAQTVEAKEVEDNRKVDTDTFDIEDGDDDDGRGKNGVAGEQMVIPRSLM